MSINQEAFDRGAKTGNQCNEVIIGVNNVWSGKGKDGSSISSYEKIGYHAGSVAFLLGVLHVSCPLRKCWFDERHNIHYETLYTLQDVERFVLRRPTTSLETTIS